MEEILAPILKQLCDGTTVNEELLSHLSLEGVITEGCVNRILSIHSNFTRAVQLYQTLMTSGVAADLPILKVAFKRSNNRRALEILDSISSPNSPTSHHLPSTSSGPAQPTTMNNTPQGKPKASIIARVLVQDRRLTSAAGCEQFCQRLPVGYHEYCTKIDHLKLGMITAESVITEVLILWKSCKGSEATIEVLVKLLRNNENALGGPAFVQAAEYLEQQFPVLTTPIDF